MYASLFNKVINGTKYKPEMRGALQAVLLDGLKNEKAAHQYGLKPATLKHAAMLLRQKAHEIDPYFDKGSRAHPRSSGWENAARRTTTPFRE